MDPISSAGPIRQAATFLFIGWGYNFYNKENQLRADDLLIRAKVSGILAQARAALRARESEYRRVNLPAPMRSSEFPAREKFEQARALERCGVAIETVATAIRAAPAPANDWVWLRHRDERGVIGVLEGIDIRLVDEAVALHDRIVELDLASVSDPGFEAAMMDWLNPLRLIVAERAERLTLMV
jgi:hypothetical protein